MVWFAVYENLAFHPKVIEAGNAAMGLWVRGGAWCTANLTDGFLPKRIAFQLGTRNMCNSLVSAGLWEWSIEGYRYHDWDAMQPSKAQIEQRRSWERKRKADQRKSKVVPLKNNWDTPEVSHQKNGGTNETCPTEKSVGVPASRYLSSGYLGTDSAVGSGAAIRGGAANCALCDEDGYRITPSGKPGAVCDHIDHAAQTTAGRALAAEALAELRNRKANR